MMKRVESEFQKVKEELLGVLNKELILGDKHSLAMSKLSVKELVETGIVYDYVSKIMAISDITPEDWYEYFEDNCLSTEIVELVDSNSSIYVPSEVTTSAQLTSYIIGLCIKIHLNKELSKTITNGNL